MFPVVLVGHWVADFLFQTRWMGNNKGKWTWNPRSEGAEALLSHVAVYTLVLTAVVGWVVEWGENFYLFVAINGSLHLLTDAVTSKFTGYFWKRRVSALSSTWQNRWERAFWSTIGLDQLIHGLCLWYTYEWLL